MLTSFSGLNQRLTPVTSAKLHRWVSILDPNTLDFELQPVTVEKTAAILIYEKAPAGSNIPADSIAPLPPGDYAWRVIGLYIWLHPIYHCIHYWVQAHMSNRLKESGKVKPSLS